MAVKVAIPPPLRVFTDQGTVTAAPGTVATVIADLDRQYPGIAARLVDEQGELRQHVTIRVNEEDIRQLAGKETPVKNDDYVVIVKITAMSRTRIFAWVGTIWGGLITARTLIFGPLPGGNVMYDLGQQTGFWFGVAMFVAGLYYLLRKE